MYEGLNVEKLKKIFTKFQENFLGLAIFKNKN